MRLYLVPHLGRLRLRDLRRHHVEQMLRTIASESSPQVKGRGGRGTATKQGRTIDGVRRSLRAALGTAQRRGLITLNPAEGRMDAIPKIRKAETSWWQPEQVDAFLKFTRGQRLLAMFEVAAFGGLRRGELCGLRWPDVDLDGGHLVVRNSLSGLAGTHPCPFCGGEHTGRRFKDPKTDASARWVPLVDLTVSALLAHRASQEWERQRFGEAYTDHALVFASPDGSPLRPDTVTKTFETLAQAAGLPRIRLHDMRHGACSLLIAAGVPIEIVAMILGHASPNVTRGVYAHVLRGPARAGMEAASALVRGDGRAQSVHSRRESDEPRREVI